MNEFVASVKNLLIKNGFSNVLMSQNVLDGVYSKWCGNGWLEVHCFGLSANHVAVWFIGDDGSLAEYGSCYNEKHLYEAFANHILVEA